MAQGECILYPCYFNTAYTRRQGRRVSQNRGLKAPVISDIERALKRIGVTCRIEDHHHPGYGGKVVSLQIGRKAKKY